MSVHVRCAFSRLHPELADKLLPQVRFAGFFSRRPRPHRPTFDGHRTPGGDDGITDRGLRAHRQHAHRGAGVAQRIHRLALRAALRLRRVLRGAARLRRARPLGAAPDGARCARRKQRYRGDTHDPGDRVRLRRRRRAHHRLHADGGRRPLRPRAHRRRPRRRGAGRDAARRPLRLRRGHAAGSSRRDDGVAIHRRARTRSCCAAPVADRTKGAPACRRTCTSRRATASRCSSPGTRRTSRRRRRSTPTSALASTEAFWRDWAGRCTYQGRWRDAVDALAAHAQGADLRADRRHRRGADDVAARGRSAASATGTIASAGCATPA